MIIPSRAAGIADTVNRKLEQLMPVLTPLGIALGFTLPGIFINLRPLVPWLFSVITFSGALKMKAAEFGKTMRSPLPILLFFFSAHVLMPLTAWFLSSLFFRAETDTVTGFILLFSAPTAVSCFIWVNMFRGDRALCLTVILLDTLLAPLLTPLSISVLMGAKTAMNMSGIAVSLILMVVVPTIIGVTVNETSRGKIPGFVCPYLNPVSKICLMLVIAANASPLASRISFGDPKVWGIAVLCVALSLTGYLFSKLAAITGRCNAEKSVTLFFSGGLRNISAVTTIAIGFFPEAAALPALFGIMFQQTLAALMGKLMLGKNKKAAEAGS